MEPFRADSAGAVKLQSQAAVERAEQAVGGRLRLAEHAGGGEGRGLALMCSKC